MSVSVRRNRWSRKEAVLSSHSGPESNTLPRTIAPNPTNPSRLHATKPPSHQARMLLLFALGYFAATTAPSITTTRTCPPWIPPEVYGLDSAFAEMQAEASPFPWAEADEARMLYNVCVHAYDDPRLKAGLGEDTCMRMMKSLRLMRNADKTTTPATPARKKWGFW